MITSMQRFRRRKGRSVLPSLSIAVKRTVSGPLAGRSSVAAPSPRVCWLPFGRVCLQPGSRQKASPAARYSACACCVTLRTANKDRLLWLWIPGWDSSVRSVAPKHFGCRKSSETVRPQPDSHRQSQRHPAPPHSSLRRTACLGFGSTLFWQCRNGVIGNRIGLGQCRCLCPGSSCDTRNACPSFQLAHCDLAIFCIVCHAAQSFDECLGKRRRCSNQMTLCHLIAGRCGKHHDAIFAGEDR